jgi:hypothetical protein
MIAAIGAILLAVIALYAAIAGRSQAAHIRERAEREA